MSEAEQKFMDRAAKAALKGWGNVEPNPMVGALIVQEKKIIGIGFHKRFGGKHAEVEAIEDAKRKSHSLAGATLYVTLEPCCHQGKQGPCTEAILKTGISTVIFATHDPNPVVRGKGVASLKAAGIKVIRRTTSITTLLNHPYLKRVREARPFIHLKTVTTRDEALTTERGTGVHMSGPESDRIVQKWRKRYDGILVGSDTVLIDNPRLTVCGAKANKQPLRIILDRRGRVSPYARVFAEPGRALWVTTHNPHKPIEHLKVNPKTPLKKILHSLKKRGVQSILVEGGEKITQSFLSEKCVDQWSRCTTPIKSKDPTAPRITLQSSNLKILRVEKKGNDVWTHFISTP